MDEEHEIDDWARQYIKDQESEKKFKELYEKALGLPYAKQRAEKSQQTVQEVTEKWNTQQKRLGKILGYIEKKDFGSFIREMKIPEDLVLQHALERIQYQELTPEQRAQYDARTAERQRLYELEEQASSSSEYAKQVATQARTLEVNTFLSRSDVQPAVQSFDNRVGKPGAFVEEVWNMGKYLALTTGMDLPVDQVVNEVIRRYGIAPNPAAMGQQGIPSANPGQKPQAKPPVIPNLSGSHSASPAKKMPGSLDDLKKLAAAANAD